MHRLQNGYNLRQHPPVIKLLGMDLMLAATKVPLVSTYCAAQAEQASIHYEHAAPTRLNCRLRLDWLVTLRPEQLAQLLCGLGENAILLGYTVEQSASRDVDVGCVLVTAAQRGSYRQMKTMGHAMGPVIARKLLGEEGPAKSARMQHSRKHILLS